MAEGDVLSILIVDEVGVPITVTLNSGGNEEEVPDAGVALPASDITANSFTANWSLTENALGFYLDVATDSAFTSFVAGYNNKDVGMATDDAVAGLSDAITYYYRIRAYNDNGTGVSSNVITTTTSIENVTDFDGNVYTYVTIGTQQWMVENLKTTSYADGTPIPNITDNTSWAALITGAYCYYNNDIANETPYGSLYNWYAVDSVHGLAIAGWRVPSPIDINTLITYIGGDTVSGGRLKEIGIGHWITPNTGALDTYGFKALPSGQRSPNTGIFLNIGTQYLLWTSDEFDSSQAYEIQVALYNSITSVVNDISPKEHGLAVRLMRDVV